jgi:serine protease Do
MVARSAFRPALLSLLCLLIVPASQAQATKAKTDKPSDARPEPNATLLQFNDALQQLAAKVSAGVVQILVNGYGPLEEGKGDAALIARQRAIGSGVIVDPSGYIMTNAHVVEGAQRIRVVLPMTLGVGEGPIVETEGKLRVLEAKLIGVHKDTDLALLKINAKDLPTLPLAANKRVIQGELVFAVGSPEGLRNTITMGVVSSIARQPDPDKAMVYIQTDAPINPGNSGGPLVDVEGSVLGINTFIYSEGGGSEGLGFAIPARVVEFVYQSLRKYGHVHRSEIEAGAQTITPDMAAALGLKQDYGVVISDVLPGGPAEAAGLKIGDIVLSVDDRPIETLPAFMGQLYLHPPDKVLKLQVMRDGQKKVLNIPVLEESHRMDQLLDLGQTEKNLVPQLAILAIAIDDQVRSMIPDLRIPSGVVVVGRAADLFGPDIGLANGDVIHAVNNRPVDTVDNLRSGLKQLKAGDPVALQIERGGKLQFLAFEMD